MKFWSEVTKSFYDTADACVKAEEEALNAQVKEKEEKKRLAAERKNRAAEVEEARKNMIAAQDKYRELLSAFVKSYGSYHLSLDGKDAEAAKYSMFDIFNPLLLNF